MAIATSIIHKVIERRYEINNSTVLNNHSAPLIGQGSIPAQIYAILRQMKALAFADGSHVDYESLRISGILQAFRDATRRLPKLTPADFETREEQLAFWINLYNGLVLDAVLEWDVKDNVKEIPGFFWKAGYQIDGCRFNAFDIEYGILRANAGHPAIPGPQIPEGDRRLAFRLDTLDPRIHFALVCGARSCPDLEVYAPESIDDQLEQAAWRFINGKDVKIDMEKNTVWLSRIFQWYAPDFEGRGSADGGAGSVPGYIARYRSDPAEVRFLNDFRPKIKYTDYDWSLNK